MNSPWSDSESARRYKWAVQALALDVSSQRQLFPDFADVPDELELDQQEAHAGFLEDWAEDISPLQRQAIDALDGQLETMGGERNAALWTVESLADAPQWSRVRELAAAVLEAMGWPLELPRTDRAIYLGPPTK